MGEKKSVSIVVWSCHIASTMLPREVDMSFFLKIPK